MNFKIFIFSIVIFLVVCLRKYISAIKIDADKFSDSFSKNFIEFFDTKQENDELQELKNILLKNQNPIELNGFSVKANGKQCLLCHSIATTIINFYNSRKFDDNEISENFLTKLCIFGDVSLPEICLQEVKNYFPFIKFILDNRNLTANDVCDRLMQSFYCFNKKAEYNEITVEKPILLGSKKYSSNSVNNLKVLQFTDFHYDPHYSVGSSINCGNWICCRGPKTFNKSDAAGKWGGKACDSPADTIKNIIEDASKRFNDVDFIYLTGDSVDHFDWTSSRDECLKSLEFVTKIIQEYFPNVPIFPIFGNHDTFPANLFAPSSITDEQLSSDWLYRNASNIWKQWLPKDALTMLETRGYYTTKLRPNFRIIALNSNECFSGNLWLLHDNFFFRDQLEWLHEILLDASNNGEKVHILSHVPSNDASCYRSWTKEFRKIVERFTHIISAQFNGHSHLDEFVVYYASENSSIALNVAWNGGAGTTFTDVYQNYKIYYVDDQTYEVNDYETWTFDLEEANKYPDNPIKWFKEYSFKSHFNVSDLSPDSLDGVVQRLILDESLFESYRRIRVKQSKSVIDSICDQKCHDKIIADILRTAVDDNDL